MNGTVLIVEDERKIAEAIAYALKREGLVWIHCSAAMKRLDS